MKKKLILGLSVAFLLTILFSLNHDKDHQKRLDHQFSKMEMNHRPRTNMIEEVIVIGQMSEVTGIKGTNLLAEVVVTAEAPKHMYAMHRGMERRGHHDSNRERNHRS